MNDFSHTIFEIADGTANNAATTHTPQIVATVTRHVGGE
jgi:hypothetical protein